MQWIIHLYQYLKNVCDCAITNLKSQFMQEGRDWVKSSEEKKKTHGISEGSWQKIIILLCLKCYYSLKSCNLVIGQFYETHKATLDHEPDLKILPISRSNIVL